MFIKSEAAQRLRKKLPSGHLPDVLGIGDCGVIAVIPTRVPTFAPGPHSRPALISKLARFFEEENEVVGELWLRQ